jgi:phage terminase large subunit-like protein
VTTSALSELRQVELENLDRLPPEKRKRAEEALKRFQIIRERNPLEAFEPHPKQEQFLGAHARTKLFVGGNQSGKTTACLVDDILQAVDWEFVPEHLRAYKRFEPPFYCRLMAPDFMNAMEQVIHVKLRELLPKDALVGGAWSRAYDKKQRVLRFRNGSWFQMTSYEQEVDKLGGVTLHRVHYDEEPPLEHRRESRIRLVRYGGQEVAGFTPTEGLSWSYDEWYVPWEKGETEPDQFFLVQVSMDDNPHLSEADRDWVLEGVPDEYKEARRHGLFVALHGLIYSEFDKRKHVIPAWGSPLPSDLNISTVIGIDPGFRYAVGVVWVAVHPDGSLTVFDEFKGQGLNVEDTAHEIHKRNAYWGISPFMYVIDPTARNRHHQTGRSDQMEYADHGILTVPGQADRKVGFNRVKLFLSDDPGTQRPRLTVTSNCLEIMQEFARYRWKEPPKSQEETRDTPVKRDDHLLDALRNVVMSRPYAPHEMQERSKESAPSRAARLDRERAAGRLTEPPRQYGMAY